MGKSAQELTGFGYPAGGSDSDIGTYKQPQPNINETDVVYKKGDTLNDMNMSLGYVTKSYRSDNPHGIKQMKGYGAATKGKKISGKQG